MNKFSAFKDLVAEFGDVADFVVIYIEEAHPTDEWFVHGLEHNYKQHQTLQQRFEAAELLTSQVDMPCPLLIDTMSDDANLKYAAVPERLYVISDGVVKYRSGKGPLGYVTAMNQMRLQLSKYK